MTTFLLLWRCGNWGDDRSFGELAHSWTSVAQTRQRGRRAITEAIGEARSYRGLRQFPHQGQSAVAGATMDLFGRGALFVAGGSTVGQLVDGTSRTQAPGALRLRAEGADSSVL